MRLVTALLLTLFVVSRSNWALAAEALPYTPHGLADLLGQKVPKALAKLTDLNADDKFAAGIDVLSGDAKVRVGKDTLPVTLMLFVRDGKIGCVRVMQDSLSVNQQQVQAQYDATVQELLDSAVKPKRDPGLGGSTSNWSFDKHGWAEVSKAYDSQGLYFYLLAGDMDASFKEYWQNYNAAASSNSFYMP